MESLTAIEIKAFVPAKDFEVSKDFYREIGFDLAWADDGLAYFHRGRSSFLLQDFFNEAHAANFMMHLLVEDVDAWWLHIQKTGVLTKYNVGSGVPEDRPWGLRDFNFFDPSGVLWRLDRRSRSLHDRFVGMPSFSVR